MKTSVTLYSRRTTPTSQDMGDLELVNTYLGWLHHARGLRWKTVDARRRQLRRWQTFCQQREIRLLEATHLDVLSWLPDVGADAKRTYLGALSGFYRWAVLEGLRADNPIDRIPRPTARRRLPRPIDDADAHWLWAECLPQHRITLGLALLCGLRAGEIAAARWEDVRFGEPIIVVVERRGAKGGREREVVAPPQLGEWLTKRRQRSGWLARGPDGQGGSAELMSQYIARLLRNVYGIDASAHQLRHWYATSMLRNGGSLRVVQEALGHASSASTDIYTKVTLSDQATVAAMLRP